MSGIINQPDAETSPLTISFMNETPEARKLDIICKCSGTRKSQIIRLVEAAVTDLDAISSATGACSGCGACDSDILDFIAEHLSLNPSLAGPGTPAATR